jgi:flagellar hook-associated protein 1 FlgK
MAGIFNSLYTAYSGLQTSQIAVNVTSNNISNASNADYTRQRATIQAKSPMYTSPGDIGTGAEVLNVTRIHDEFVYKRFTSASMQKEFTDFEESTLTEVSKYFPDIAKTGVSKYKKLF